MAAVRPVHPASAPATAPARPAGVAAAVVPAGAAPVAPVFVPPAEEYEDDEEEVEEIMRPEKGVGPLKQSGTSVAVIFFTALVVITLSAVGAFYGLASIRSSGTTEAPETSTTTTVKYVLSTNSTGALVDELEPAVTTGALDEADRGGETFPTVPAEYV